MTLRAEQTHPRTAFVFARGGKDRPRLSFVKMREGDREIVCLGTDTSEQWRAAEDYVRAQPYKLDHHTRSRRRRQQVAAVIKDAAAVIGLPLSDAALERLDGWVNRYA